MITTFGEVLIDMLAARVHLGKADADDCYYPVPGGAPANVAVAIARLGGDSRFVGGISDDAFGRQLKSALESYRVDTSGCFTSDRATALAFVSIDDEGERSFAFYGQSAAHLDFPVDEVPSATPSEIRHFSSNTLTETGIREATRRFAASGHASFDVNFRPGLWAAPDDAAGVVDEFARASSIIKTSLEELEALFGAGGVESVIEQWLAATPELIVVTDGPGDMRVIRVDGEFRVSPPAVSAVDTTAAGDAFVGGLLFSLSPILDRSPEGWSSDADALRDAVSFGACCGALAVQRPGAFPSLPTLPDVEELLTSQNQAPA